MEQHYNNSAVCENSFEEPFVDKRCRRIGIGSLLVKEAERFCKRPGYRLIYLHTHKYLPCTLNFWQSQGFMVRVDESGPLQTVHLEKVL